MWEIILPILISAVIVAGAIIYIVHAKKKGVKCIGCPNAKHCSSCSHCGSANTKSTGE